MYYSAVRVVNYKPTCKKHICCLVHRLSKCLEEVWNKREARKLETSEKRERGIMGTTA